MLCPRCGQLNDPQATECESCFTSLSSDTSIINQESISSSPYEIEKLDRRTNSFAAAGMLLGIGSLISCCTFPVTGLYIPGILGFISLIISLVGKKQIQEKDTTDSGNKLAAIGIVSGALSLSSSIILLILWLLGIMAIDGLKDYWPHIH